MTQGYEENNESTQGSGSVIAGEPDLGPGSVIGGPGIHGAITGANSSAGPALAAFDNRLQMTWKGVVSDQHLYHASFDGNGWSAPATITNANSSAGPALAAFNNRLHMTWKGGAGDQRLWHASFDGSDWSAPVAIPAANSSTDPELAVFNNRLHMTWKGTEGDQRLWHASFDGNGWSAPQRVTGANSSAGPTLDAKSDGSLDLRMAFKGVEGDQHLFEAFNSGSGWSAPVAIPAANSSAGPALAVFRFSESFSQVQNFCLAWRGAEGDQRIFKSTRHLSATVSGLYFWKQPSTIPGANSSTGPALAVFNDLLHMTWKGAEGDQRIFHASFDDFAWEN